MNGTARSQTPCSVAYNSAASETLAALIMVCFMKNSLDDRSAYPLVQGRMPQRRPSGNCQLSIFDSRCVPPGFVSTLPNILRQYFMALEGSLPRTKYTTLHAVDGPRARNAKSIAHRSH